jgi:myo-inositol-1(or 4)-monophosphatase
VELLAVAERAAGAAATLIRDTTLIAQPALGPRGSDKGLVTELDLAAELCIRETILSQRPDDGIIGEEFGRLPGRSEVEWIVDPIDGTTNYVAGLGQWSVSIAARVNGRVEAAVVQVPRSSHTYTALAGFGAWCNGVRLPRRRARAQTLDDAVVATGFADSDDVRSEQIQQLTRVLGTVRDVRCHGAASIELCKVAIGEIDAYYESNLCLWDVAAAALVATEAGVEVLDGPESGGEALVAAPPLLARSLRRLIASSLEPASAIQ